MLRLLLYIITSVYKNHKILSLKITKEKFFLSNFIKSYKVRSDLDFILVTHK